MKQAAIYLLSLDAGHFLNIHWVKGLNEHGPDLKRKYSYEKRDIWKQSRIAKFAKEIFIVIAWEMTICLCNINENNKMKEKLWIMVGRLVS